MINEFCNAEDADEGDVAQAGPSGTLLKFSLPFLNSSHDLPSRP